MGSEAEIAAIEETPDEAATDGERAKLTAAKEACAMLRERIAAVADETRRLTDGVNGFDVDRVTSDDKAQIEELIAGIDALLGGDNLTDGERAALEALKDTAQALIDRIAATKAAAESDEFRAVDGIGKDNVKREDKDALIVAKKAAEDALRDFDGNYTDEEREALKETLDTVQAALDAIGNAEKAAEEIDRLPAADEVGPDDKDGIDRVKKIVDGLTENERHAGRRGGQAGCAGREDPCACGQQERYAQDRRDERSCAVVRAAVRQRRGIRRDPAGREKENRRVIIGGTAAQKAAVPPWHRAANDRRKTDVRPSRGCV